MKKTLLTALAAVAVAASTYGQGTVNFVNGTGNLVNFQANAGGPIVAAPSGQGILLQLLWAPAGTANLEAFQAVGLTANAGTPLAGRFSGGSRTIPGIPAGGLADLIVIGYVGSIANLITGDGATHYGRTTVFQVDTGDPTTVPAGTPTSLATLMPGFTIVPVPEPSSMALAGLGAASLLIFRRRK